MTPQDVQALEAFLSQLTQARVDNKDAQAAAMIADAAARQPDTAYLLVQRTMLLDRALVQAQARIQSLQTQLLAAGGQGNRGFMDNDTAWGNSAGRASQPYQPQQPQQQPQQPQPPQYQAQPTQPQPAQYQAAPAQPARPGFLSGGLGGTLGSIATTAAGVAGGAMLFQGIENLFHRGSGGGGFFGGQPATGSETVVNNFYGDDNGGSGGRGDNALLADNGNLDNGLDDYVDSSQDDDSSFF